MAYYTVKFCYINILETGTVTLVGDVQNPSFPSYRLYDRDIGKLFKFNTGGTGLYILVNQGASPVAIDRLIIPPGHNLNGEVCLLQYSTDNINWVDAISLWPQTDALIINKTFSSQTKQYWKFVITTAAVPEIPELFLTSTYSFERQVRINLTEKHQTNVYREESLSGRVRRVKNGLERRARKYSVLASAAQKTSLETWNTTYDGTKMFYVIDHNGTPIYMEMLNDLEFEFVSNDYSNVVFDLLEVL